MNDIECPYCEGENEVEHDGEYGSAEGIAHEMECDHCKKNFVFHTAMSFDYSPKKADCLNGSPHKFGEWKYLWMDWQSLSKQRRQCEDCGDEDTRFIPPVSTKEDVQD